MHRPPPQGSPLECVLWHLLAFQPAGTQVPQPSCPHDPVLPIAPGFPPDLLAEIGPLCTGARFPLNLARRHEGIFVSRPGSCLQPMNLTGGALASRPPGKPLHGLFGERFSTDKRLVEDLTGGFFWESLSGSCLVTIQPFPSPPLPGVSALQEKEVSTETGGRPRESSDALYFFRVKCTPCQGG